MYKLNVYVDDNQVVHICPKNAMEMVWAKHWLQELAKHGMALIDVQSTTDMYKAIKAESALK